MANYTGFAAWLAALGGTYSRASTASYYNSSGVLTQAASGELRYDYDPVTHAAKGILLEGARTNLCLKSDIPYVSSSSLDGWTNGSDRLTFTQVAGAPDGGNATKLSNTSGGSTLYYIVQTINVSGSTAYAVTAFVKYVAGSGWMWIVGGQSSNKFAWFNVLTGTVGSATAQFTNTAITAIGGGWYRISAVYTSAGGDTTTAFGFGLDDADGSTASFNPAGADQEQILVWGAQFEAGAFASSYIPTTSASVTRAADVLTFPTSPWLNTSAGTFFMKGSAAHDVSSEVIVALNASGTYGTGNGLLCRVNSDVTADVGGYATSVQVTIPSVLTNGYSLCCVYASTLQRIVSGAASNENNTCDFTGSGTTRCQFGALDATGTYSFFGHIRQVGYWPFRVTDAELQRLTT